MQKNAIEPKDYTIIGKLHARENPSAALNLLENYKRVQSSALDTKLHKLNRHFFNFCKHFGLNPSEYLGALYNREKVDKRRLFVGVMLKVYQPHQIAYDISAQTGLANALCIVLDVEPGNMTKLLDESIVLINNNFYAFRDEVEELAVKLVDMMKGYGASLFDELQESA